MAMNQRPLLLLTLLVWPTALFAESTAVPLPDKGIFADLDPQVRLVKPTWLPVEQRPAVGLRASWWVAFGAAIGVASGSGDHPTYDPAGDADGDGIPDPLDILIGAKKTALDNAPYGSPYRALPYPMGDVPRAEGVCTDVIIRALRNAGLDLQRLVREDIARAPAAYPMVRTANPNIDHRRVKTILPWFKRHWDQLATDSTNLRDWLPGDVVFMDTLSKPGPDHIGIVSDRLGPSGRPLVINSWTDGYRTSEMDLLTMVPVTHRFRVPVRPREQLQRSWQQAQWAPDNDVRQIVEVRAEAVNSSFASLQRWQRDRSGIWQRMGTAIDVRLGHAGVAWGRGLGKDQQTGGQKREGDGRSPLGAFALGTAFGSKSEAVHTAAPRGVRWPWRTTSAADRWVDDPASPLYNQWTQASQQQPAQWRSAEVLARTDGLYDLGLVIAHNMAPVVAGSGSAIFVHLANDGPTTGCTALHRSHMLELLRWLQPAAKPVWLQVLAQ